ncbi:isochorismatase [Erythrobacter sp. QSSC1-22B]|uniref:isochorismatase family protein n=1 Tax=Erythrobacter sp. QSSC1-22B TaxID=1860125 RepID=UPI000805CC2F|nr:isochorismatase family protein [Erythrobacter sp. QSSC1-22B]OBX17836.1 isochorismatase [Erythrobacter sp. QSSC1-22B]
MAGLGTKLSAEPVAGMVGIRMIEDGKTARELFDAVMANPARKKFGFGEKLAIVNVDVQQAYTRPDLFRTAYETDPAQIEHINRISHMARERGLPVVWSRVGYKDDAGDAGVWGTRTDSEDSLQNIKYGSERHAYDPRCDIQPDDLQYTKRMPSAFFETPLASYLTWHRVDTVVVTGGSTSGCVRATAVDALSHGYRTIVPIETTADKHASYHFANLTDLQLKYADVESVQAVVDWLEAG